MLKQLKENINAILLGCVGFCLAFKSVSDLDFWWHLSTGRWIVEHKEFVKSDFLSYTFKDSPWMDLTWGFEVIQYLLYSVTHNYWLVSLFFGLMGFLTAYFSYRTVGTLQDKKDSGRDFVTLFLCAVALYFVDFRWIHRPEQFTHLFGAILIFLLFKNQKEETKTTWWIPVVQIAWVNTHGLFLIGPVITGVFLFQKTVNKDLSKMLEAVKKDNLLKVLLAQLVVCLINPRGWEGATFPFHLWEVLNHSFYRNTIPEATNPYKDGVWGTDTWALTVFFVLFCFSLLYPAKKEEVKAKVSFYGVGYLIFCLLLFRLSVIARRNIALFIIWALPFVCIELSQRILDFVAFFREEKFKEKAFVYSCVIALLMCLGLATNLMRSEISNVRFGGQISSYEFPIDSLDTLSKMDPQPRYFAGVQFSDFMGFHLKGYEPYIDGRFAEVYPREHFQRYMDILAHPRLIDEEVEQRKIKAMGLETRNPMLHALIRYISLSPKWKLIYLDEAAVVFMKLGEGDSPVNNAQIADQLGKTRMEKIIQNMPNWNPINLRANSDIAVGLTRLSESLLLLEASERADEVLARALKIENEFPAALSMQCVSAFSLLEKRVSSVGNNNEKLSQLLGQESPLVEEKCRKAKKRGADKTSALFTSALLHLNLGRFEDSAREFSELVKRDPLGPQGHMLLGRSYASMGRIQEAESSYLEAARLRPMEGEPLQELANIMEHTGQKEKAKLYKDEAMNRMKMQSMQH